MGRIIEIVPYNTDWPSLYEKESLLLTELLGDLVHSIHHVGSTAVPGLMAKPIIDILLEIKDLELLDEKKSSMQQSGYTTKGEFGITGRRFFVKGKEENPTHHVHAFSVGSKEMLRHIAFRNYLRSNPIIASEYGMLKKHIALYCNNDIDQYCSEKDAFIKKHEQIALMESAPIESG